MPARKAFFSSAANLVCARSKLAFRLIRLAALFALSAFSFPNLTAAPPADSNSLRIYFIDAEGGQATLFVTPDGQSLLIDTGWPGNAGADPRSATPGTTPFTDRDTGRILAAAKDAGLSRIDFVLITHYHVDHVGGVSHLAERIPIGTFIDHGENREPDSDLTKVFFTAYQNVLASGKSQHLVAKPGDVLPINGMRAEIVTSGGEVIQKPLPGAGQPNPACDNFHPLADTSENHYSVGTLITFGKLKILDLGDLTSDQEKKLMCPNNRLGHVDIYIASHHGLFRSGSAALVHAIAPRIAIVDNGATKGGSPSALDIIKTSPGIAGVWQLHFSDEAAEHNAPLEYIANPQGTVDGNYLKLAAGLDGSFEMFNSRTNKSQQYAVVTLKR